MSINGISKKPTLRFTDYTDEWDYVRGDELFAPISNKEHNSDLPILALTQDQGAVPRDLINYNVIVSDKSVAGYKVVEIDDFIISLRSFQGGIEYSRYKGLCSPAYIVLRKKDNNLSSDFYRIYFKSFNYIQELNKKLEGIRDGKMVSYGQFSEILLPKPSFSEQQKIADCISALEDLISSQDQKVDALKAHKQGLMQQLFPQNGETTPRLRFPGFTGAWEVKPLSHYLHEHKTKSDGKCEVHSVSVTKGVINQVEYLGRSFAASDTSKYNLAKPGDIIYTKSPTGAFPYGIVKQNKNPYNVIVSPLYAVYTPVNQCVGYILDSFFESSVNTNNYLSSLIQKGAKNTIQISNDTFVSKSMCLPSNPAEQQKIAECLESFDSLIAAEIQELEFLKVHKKGLMQQLFPQPVK